MQVVFVLLAGLGAFAQDGVPQRLSGIISDYTQAANVGGPWEVRGHWSLHVHDDSGTADFSAALAMVHSDLGVTLSANPNLNDPKARNAHTHHITLVGGTVSAIPNGFRISGPATITGNRKFSPAVWSDLNLAGRHHWRQYGHLLQHCAHIRRPGRGTLRVKCDQRRGRTIQRRQGARRRLRLN